MKTTIEQVSINRLAGEECPKDLDNLILNAGALLDNMGININGEQYWEPWTDKSYLSESDLQNRDIMSNVKAIDELFGYIKFVAETDGGEFIGYWCGPENNQICDAPLVYYDTEGQFELCGSRFVEALFFLVYDDDLLEQLRCICKTVGIPLEFESIDDISIPKMNLTPNELHEIKYDEYLRNA